MIRFVERISLVLILKEAQAWPIKPFIISSIISKWWSKHCWAVALFALSLTSPLSLWSWKHTCDCMCVIRQAASVRFFLPMNYGACSFQQCEEMKLQAVQSLRCVYSPSVPPAVMLMKEWGQLHTLWLMLLRERREKAQCRFVLGCLDESVLA